MNYVLRITTACVALGLSGCGGASTSLPSIPNPLSGLKSPEAEPPAISGPILLEGEAPSVELGSGGLAPDDLDTTSAEMLLAKQWQA
jgi:hypothetical protein